MAREIIFPEQNLPGGDFKILFTIDNDATPNLIVYRYDRDFNPIEGNTLHWLPYSSGATVSAISGQMSVHIDAVLNGANFLSTTAGKRYKIVAEFYDALGGTVPIKIYVGGVFIGNAASRVGVTTLYFTASNNNNILYLKSDQDFKVYSISVIEVDYAYNVKMGDVEVGNDNDLEWIMYPGNFELEFKVQPDIISSFYRDFTKWLEVDNALNNYDAFITIQKYKDEQWQEWFKVKIDREDIGSDSKTKVFKVRGLDGLTKIKEDRYVDPATYYEAYTRSKLEDVIATRFDGLGGNNVIDFVTDFKFIEKNTSTEYGLADLYMNEIAMEYPSDNFPFSTKGDQLKALMHNLASYFIMGLFKKKIVMPLEYNGGEIYTLYANEMPPLEKFIVKKFDGLNKYYHGGVGNYSLGRDYIINREDRFMYAGNHWAGYNGGTIIQGDGYIEINYAARLGDLDVGLLKLGSIYTIGLNIISLNNNIMLRINDEYIGPITTTGRHSFAFSSDQNNNEIHIYSTDGVFKLTEVTLQEGDLTPALITPEGDANSDYADVYFPFPVDYTSKESEYPVLTLDSAGTRALELKRVKYKQRDGSYSGEDSLGNHSASIMLGQLSSGRYGFIAKPKGTEIPLDKFFEIRQSRSNSIKIIDAVFRAKKMVVSPSNNRTELYLVKC